MVQGKRVFCFEEKLGIIHERVFYPTKLVKIKFMRIIVKRILSKKYAFADLLLKDAIKEYTGCNEIANLYKGQSLSDSSFYIKWRNKIKQHPHFQEFSKPMVEARKQKNDKIREARVIEMIQKACSVESIIRSCKKNAGKKNGHIVPSRV